MMLSIIVFNQNQVYAGNKFNIHECESLRLGLSHAEAAYLTHLDMLKLSTNGCIELSATSTSGSKKSL